MDSFAGRPILIAGALRRALTSAATILVAGALFAGAGALESIHPAGVFMNFRGTNFPGSPALGKICAGDTVARLSVPRLGFEAAVREGVDEATLAYGPGHVPGTALPGEERHAVIAIARDTVTPFASKLALGDVIELRTPFGLRSYRVVERRTLRADEVTLDTLDPTDEPALTLLAPYPSDSIGPAPLRLAVRAEPWEPVLATSRTRSETRSTERSSTPAAVGVSTALPEGR